MKYLKKHLENNGFYVHIPLLPGHGTHYKDLVGIKWEEFAFFVTEEFLILHRQYKSVSVSGLCLGAVLSLYLGITQKEKVLSIAPISTTLFYDGWSLPALSKYISFFRYTPFYFFYNLPEEEPYGIKDERIRKWIAKEMKDSSTTHYSKIPFRSFWQMHLLNEFVRNNLNEIVSPVFAIHPLEDDVASIKSVGLMKKSIIKSKFENLILHDSYHLATLDRERDLVSRSVGEFFLKNLTLSLK